jgi:hypothetical protein
LLLRILPFVYAAIVVYLMVDCYRHRREALWYLVLLIPLWGVGLYLWRFKFGKD